MPSDNGGPSGSENLRRPADFVPPTPGRPPGAPQQAPEALGDGTTQPSQDVRSSRPVDDLNKLFEQVYPEVRLIARRAMRGERSTHTLQPTALVHEVFLRMYREQRARLVDRGHVLARAAEEMRRVLVNYAKQHQAQKRGGGVPDLTLDGRAQIEDPSIPVWDILELEAGLHALEADTKAGPRHVRVVELLYYGGLTSAEASTELGVSQRTVERDWQYARTFLHDFID